MKRILIDTNLIIDREKNSIIDEKLSSLLRMLYDSDTYKLVIHPMSIEELSRNPNRKEREVMLSKVCSYALIDNPPLAPDGFHKTVGGTKIPNDIIDNNLLYAVKRNCVSFLLTNDHGIKKRARKIELHERVLSVQEALKRFHTKEKDYYKPTAIQEEYFYNLNLNDPFFSSLRDDYDGFEAWYRKKSEDNQRAYCSFKKNKGLGSFLYLKEETRDEVDASIREYFGDGSILKVATMKVDESGRYLGESYIRMIFEEAQSKGIDQIYVTVFPKQEQLIELFQKYGFAVVGTKKTRRANGEREEEFILYRRVSDAGYPNIVWSTNAFVIPIQPKYVEKLFPDAIENRQMHMEDLFGGISFSNAIKKAYICNSNCNQIRPGDVVLFYASGGRKSIITVGIIDEVYSGFQRPEDVLDVARKRTVYSLDEINELFKENATKVLLFRHHKVLANPITFDELKKRGILKGYPISIVQVEGRRVKNLVK